MTALVTGATLLLTTPAAAQRAEITQETFDRDGLPSLVANPTPNGAQGRIVGWRICTPTGGCRPVPGAEADMRVLRPGDLPAGTLFEVDAVARDGQRTTDRSGVWLGRPTAVAAPAVADLPRVGELVRPVAGSWTGGWGEESDWLGLEACRDPSGQRCETLSSQRLGPASCPGAAAVVGRRHAGWWIRAVDQRFAKDTAFTAIGYASPRAIPLPAASQTTARSGLVGPVLAQRRDFAECRAPHIRFRGRAGRRAGRLVLADVDCASTCDVALQVRVRDRRRALRVRTEPSAGGEVGIPPSTRIAGSEVRVRVVVNGRHRAQATVRLR